MNADKQKQAQQQQQQQQHGATNDNIYNNKLKSRWSNWVEEQNRKNGIRASKPANIVVLKFAVVLCVGLLVWCYYVYVGRICTPMIRQSSGARGSRAEGIVFLIFFNILWLLLAYSYALVCLTRPGFAKDVVQRGPRPEPPQLGHAPNQQYTSPLSNDNDLIAGPQYIPPVQSANIPLHADQSANTDTISGPASDASEHTLVQPTMAQPESIARNTAGHTSGMGQQNGQLAHPLEDTQVVADKYGQTGALGAGIANAAAALDTRAEHNNIAGQTYITPSISQPPVRYAGPAQGKQHRMNGPEESFTPKVHREPPRTMPLHPNSRYCERCELVKPFRAHHCRHCGTCILGMDHHCPWIGQCCGARNHIYFVVFCFWACISLGYVFITLLIALIAPNISPKPESVDVQTIVICAIAAVLSFFTGSMLVTHIVLILNGQSTIESISISDMKHHETTSLNAKYSLFAFKSKIREKRLMDKEWGNLDTEAHLWYQGNKSKNWYNVMGNKRLYWFIPPPNYTPDKGLEYTPNPRRGPNGEWRRREDWPKELQ